MKSKILSFLAVLTCLCFTASPLCVGAVTAPIIEEVVLETAFSELIAESKKALTSDGSDSYDNGILGISNYVYRHAMEIALQHATADNNTNTPVLQTPAFDIVTGKYQMTWDIGKYSSLMETVPSSIFTDDILIECTMLLCDSWSAEYKEPTTGVTYYSNALNISITRTNGSISRYVVVFPSSFNYSHAVSVTSSYVAVSAQSGCTLYSVSGGVIGQVVESNFYMENVRFNCNNVNLTTVNANSTLNTIPQVKAYPTGIWSYRGNSVTSSGIDYPIDKDICHGVFNMYFPYNDGSSGSRSYAFYCLRYLTCGFYTTNNYNHQGVVNNNWTNNYQQNYYNFPLTNNTPITKDNYLDLNLPALAPVFDIDTKDSAWLQTLLALLPTLLDLLDADLLPSILDLLGHLTDFWSNMPEIGMEWDVDPTLNNNNYMELDFPSSNPPDSGGGGMGDITVNVEITRPKIPAIDTSPHVTLYYPTVTTTALPANIVQAGAKFVDWGKEITDLTGTTNIIIVCGLVGVGVMLIFKDW